MSEQDNTGKAITTVDPQPAPAPRPRVVFTPVDSPMGIMDTARFEHLGRVATVMARAGLMPMSLTHFKPPGWKKDDPLEPLPMDVIQARAYLIANQADLWHADPNAVSQCTSIVHGKLMFEGKLVHGILSARLGVDLDYEFGAYNASKRDIEGVRTEDGAWEGKMPASVDDQALGVRVVGTLPGEPRPRWIAGSVAMWHKGAQSPWQAATAWPRQLRYMGAREWCRAYKPSLLLGIITDDEIEEYRMGLESGQLMPSTAPMLTGAFEEQRRAEMLPPPAKTTAEAQERVRGKRAARAAAAEAEPRPTTQEGPTETGGAPVAEPEPDTSGPAAHASGDGAPQAEGSGPSAPAADDVQPGAAPAGEVYLLAGDEFNAEGKRLTYKDGVRFSSTKPQGVDQFKVYEWHAPELPEAEDPLDGDDLPEHLRDPNAPSTVEQAQAESLVDHEEQEDEDEELEELPPEFSAYVGEIEKAGDFGAAKATIKEFMGGTFWAGLTADQQNGVRRSTWETLMENLFPADRPDPFADVSAYRLWIEAQDDPETVEQGLSKLEEHPDFQAKPDGLKEQLRGATAARLKLLEDGE